LEGTPKAPWEEKTEGTELEKSDEKDADDE